MEPTGQGLTVHARAAGARPRLNRFAWYLGGGMVYTGAFPCRGQDEAALALSVAGNGEPYLGAQRAAGSPVERAEIALELSYLGRLTHGLAAQLDVQHIWFANTGLGSNDATVLIARLQAEL